MDKTNVFVIVTAWLNTWPSVGVQDYRRRLREHMIVKTLVYE